MIDKKKMFAKGTPKREAVTVPGIKEKVTVRGLSAAQRGMLFLEVFEDGKPKEGKFFAAELVARCVIDDEGKRVFEDSDVEELGTMAPEFLDPLFEAANRLSGLATTATDDATKN